MDEAFAVFDLGERRAYAVALSAHARVVPSLEYVLAPAAWSGFVPRGPWLAADRSELGRPLPSALPLPDLTSDASAWGAQYVLEGSRLGGAMLARQVGPGLPHRYLGAVHTEGGWRAFQSELNAAAKVDDEREWLDTAVAAAGAVFLMFEQAVQAELAGFSER